MLNIRSTVPGSDSARSNASAVSTVALAIVIVPQIVLRAMSYSERSIGVVIALVVGAATVGTSLYVAQLLHRRVPRRSSHQLTDRHIAHWAGLLVSAARILGYALLVILGIELAVGSLNSILDLNWNAWLDPILILAMAVPVVTGVGKNRQRWIIVFSAFASIALVGLLAYGLIQEAIGAIDFDNIRLARKDAYATERVTDSAMPLMEAAFGGAFLGAVASLISERVMAPTDERRVPPRDLAKIMVLAYLVIAVTLYFVVELQMPGKRVAIPSLSMAYAFFGELGQTVLIVLYILLGLSVAYSSFSQLPRLLRELALDGLLPRRLAAADAVAPRRLIIATIATMAAVVTLVLDSARSLSSVFVLTIYTVVILTSAAMVFRAKNVLEDSVDTRERRDARFYGWVFRGYAVFAAIVAGAVVVTKPSWALAGALALTVPVIFLVFYSRGQTKLSQQLQLSSISGGRHLPTRVHGVILIERVNEATIQAVTWGRAMRLSSLTAVAVDIDPKQTRAIRDAWSKAMVPVDLTILGEPKGAMRGPVIEYVRTRHRDNPHDLIAIILPRLISSSSWEAFFLRHSTAQVVSDLRREPNVMICEAPYRLGEDDQ